MQAVADSRPGIEVVAADSPVAPHIGVGSLAVAGHNPGPVGTARDMVAAAVPDTLADRARIEPADRMVDNPVALVANKRGARCRMALDNHLGPLHIQVEKLADSLLLVEVDTRILAAGNQVAHFVALRKVGSRILAAARRMVAPPVQHKWVEHHIVYSLEVLAGVGFPKSERR